MNDPNPSQLHMTIHLENTLKDLLKNRLEIQEEMNSKVLMDFYGASESFEADLKPIEPMQNEINNIKGSIHLLKFE